MIRALTQDLTVPLYGYVTHTLRTNADGFHEIYLFPYGAADPGRRRPAMWATVTPAAG